MLQSEKFYNSKNDTEQKSWLNEIMIVGSLFIWTLTVFTR